MTVELTPEQRHALPDGATVRFRGWKHPNVGQSTIGELVRRYRDENGWGRLISPGDVCVDVGAHMGDTALVMAACARSFSGPSVVLAVEPNLDAAVALRANAEANRDWADIRISNNAVTATDGEAVELLDHGNGNVNGGLVGQNYSPGWRDALEQLAVARTPVTGMTLESLCRANLSDEEMNRLRFVKTDCEGYDKEILRAAADFIRSRRLVLFVEWFDLFLHGEDYDDFLVAVRDLGHVALNPATLRPHDLSVKISDLVLVPPDHPLLSS